MNQKGWRLECVRGCWKEGWLETVLKRETKNVNNLNAKDKRKENYNFLNVFYALKFSRTLSHLILT